MAVEKFNRVWELSDVKDETLKLPMSSELMQQVRKRIMWGEFDMAISQYRDWQSVLLPQLNSIIDQEQKR